MAEDKLFYVGQKAFIDKEGAILVLEAPKGLDFPGGKIQDGEIDFNEALKREVREETTLEIEVGEPFMTWYRVGSEERFNGRTIFLVGYKCLYKSGEVRLSDEHSKFEWVNKENYRKLDDGGLYFKALEKYIQGA